MLTGQLFEFSLCVCVWGGGGGWGGGGRDDGPALNADRAAF